MTLAPGARLGRYEVLSPLGSGGMGEVYRARDPRLDRDVAIKVLNERVTGDRSAVDRFIREARAASALNHPNIVTVHELGEGDAGRFLVMELFAGRTLRPPAGAGALPFDTIIDVGSQIARALATAHAAGIVHRDIKPENVLLRDDGYVKVLDFGLGRLKPESSATHVETGVATSAGLIVGTMRYMSPEQATGQGVGPASDIFSLGLVLYELATGHHPFGADSNSSVVVAAIKSPALPPSRLNPALPPAFDDLILRMLEKDARSRPAAGDVERALQRLVDRPRADAPARETAPRRPFVGRERERAELRAGLEAVATGEGLLVTVAGEPGLGKTTLVEDVLDQIRAGGERFAIASGRCSERLTSAGAYLPVLDAFDHLLRGDDRELVAPLLKQVAPSWYVQVVPLDDSVARPDEATGPGSAERMTRELTRFVQDLSRTRPLVLFIDDVHWADASTLELLRYLAGRFDAMRLLMLATYRPAELATGKHPFLALKSDLLARRRAREVRLAFLTLEDIEQYLAQAFPSRDFPRELSAFVHARTEGNPLFMVDLLRYLCERGVIGERDGGWTLLQPIAAIERDIPESVRSMIDRKIDQLDESDRRLLVAASVEGGRFDSAILARVLGLEAADVEERLEALDAVHGFARFIDEHTFPDGTLTLRYRFVHILYQNALYASLRPTRRTTLSKAMAEALAAAHGGEVGPVASEVALLFEAGRDFLRAAQYFVLASQRAARLSASHETIVLARRGLEMLARVPEGAERDRTELAVQCALGPALIVTRGFASPEVEQAYTRGRELCERLDNPPELFQVLIGLWNFNLVRTKLREARQLADSLVTLAPSLGNPGLLLPAHRAVGETSFWLGELAPAREHLEQVLGLYDPAQHAQYVARSGHDPHVVCQGFLAWTLWLLGYPDRALAAMQEAFALASRLAHPPSIALALQNFMMVHQFRREVAEVEERAAALIALSGQEGFQLWSAGGTLLKGWARSERGDPQGIADMRQSLEAWRATGAELPVPYYLELIAEACRKAGQPDKGLTFLDEGLAAAKRSGESWWTAEIFRLKGELRLAESPDAEREAELYFLKAIDIARHQRARSLELRAVASMSRLWRRQGRIDEARQSLAEVYDWFSDGLATADLRDARALLDEMS